jgi:hypothetical protein
MPVINYAIPAPSLSRASNPLHMKRTHLAPRQTNQISKIMRIPHRQKFRAIQTTA